MTEFADLNPTGRFVILIHDHPHLHWDFMLETSGVLKTWRLAEEPRTGATTAATVLPDHRIEYLEYEGPVSHNRGTVTRFDAGTYQMDIGSKPPELLLAGQNLSCRVRLAAGQFQFLPAIDPI